MKNDLTRDRQVMDAALRGGTLAITLVAMAAALLSGCASKGPTQHVPAVQRNYDAIWDASVEVLREKYYFRLDRQDRLDGYISTLPETGKSWFEFWRKDGAAWRDTAESSLQTIYRAAIVTIHKTEGSDDYQIDVRVKVSRSDLPTMQITDTSDAYEMFQLSETKRAHFLLNYGKEVGKAPVDLPDDAGLAAKIKADILKRMAKKLAKPS